MAGKPDLPGMNRMREAKNKYETTASLLAAAFAASGKKEAARDLLADAANKNMCITGGATPTVPICATRPFVWKR
jgi:hypothetical protein